MDTRVGLAALLLGASLLAGCGSATGDATARAESTQPVAAGDPAYALSALRNLDEGDYGVLPADLEESLPNHRVTVIGKDSNHTSRFSQALVVGRVTQVTRGAGVVWREDESFTLVGYDDSRADTRTALVTMSVDQMTGVALPASRTVTFRILVPHGTDPERFAEGLAGLGRIAAVLDRDPNPIDPTPWRPFLDDKMIAVVADDGTLTLPTLPHGRSFAGDIRTVDDLLSAARGPVTTSTVDLHELYR